MTEQLGDYVQPATGDSVPLGCPPNVDFCDGGDACWDVCNQWRGAGDEAPWEADDWKDRTVVERLQVVHDLMDDRGTCPYLRRGESGQDPQGICDRGCHEEPSCMTDRWGPWPSELLREVIADLVRSDRGCPRGARSDSDG